MAAGIFLHVFAVFAIQVFRDWGGFLRDRDASRGSVCEQRDPSEQLKQFNLSKNSSFRRGRCGFSRRVLND